MDSLSALNRGWGQRWRDVDFSSASLTRAAAIAAAQVDTPTPDPLAARVRQRRDAAWLASYGWRAPALDVKLTATPPGRMIAEHLAIREGRHRPYRSAQGVLPLPDQVAEYLRGRRRQALRTNLRHAAQQGYSISSRVAPEWVPGADDTRRPHLSPGPVEAWTVRRGVELLAAAVVSVDAHVALLHGLVTYSTPESPAGGPYVRWLLHHAIVERLCGRCELLLTNSPPVYRISQGNRHFQRLLGYQVANLRPTTATAAWLPAAAPARSLSAAPAAQTSA